MTSLHRLDVSILSCIWSTTGEPWGVFGEYIQDLNSGEWEILLQRIGNIHQLNLKSTAWDVRLIAIVFNMDTGV